MLRAILPALILSSAGIFLLLLRLFKLKKDSFAFGFSILALILSMAFIPLSKGEKNFPTLIQDEMAIFFQFLVTLSSFLILIISWDYIRENKWGFVEYSSLLLFATVGMYFLVGSKDFLTLYIGLELMALSSYVLTGYARGEAKAFEASFKYFILGAFSSGILLYGISLIYGTTGDLSIEKTILSENPNILLKGGMLLVLCGLLFKVAAIPFHIWTPDVYEGAPNPITAFFSIGPKASAFAAFVRIFWGIFLPFSSDWQFVLGIVAFLTMVGGNLMAIVQENIKRLLAYASIGSAGYILLGFISLNEFSLKGIFYYLFAFLFAMVGIFSVVIYLNKKGYSTEEVKDFNGLNKKHPYISFSLLIFLLSLIGIPGTAGFVGKFFLFGSAIKGGFFLLAIVGVLMSTVSLYYYFRIVVLMYIGEEEEINLRKSFTLLLSLTLCLLGTLIFGFYPSFLLKLLWIKL